MSYILDSLKKSEKERSQDSVLNSSIAQPEFIENKRSNQSPNKIIGLIILALLLIAIIFYGSYRYMLSQEIVLNKPEAGGINITNEHASPLKSTGVVQRELDVPINSEINTSLNSDVSSLYNQSKKASQSKVSIQKSNDVISKANRVDSESQLSVADDQLVSSPSSEDPLLEEEEQSQNSGLEPTKKNDLSNSEVEIAGTSNPSSSNNEPSIESIFNLDRSSQRNIPSIEYGAHIYASDNKSGFVILNGSKKRQGDRLRSGVFIEKIAEDHVVLSHNGLLFSLPAMKNWSYE